MTKKIENEDLEEKLKQAILNKIKSANPLDFTLFDNSETDYFGIPPNKVIFYHSGDNLKVHYPLYGLIEEKYAYLIYPHEGYIVLFGKIRVFEGSEQIIEFDLNITDSNELLDKISNAQTEYKEQQEQIRKEQEQKTLRMNQEKEKQKEIKQKEDLLKHLNK